MDPEGNKFGRGPRELTGAVDLISHYKLLPHHEFFCKKSLSFSISDTHYLHNMAGDTEIRKGEGMQLDQLIQSTSYARYINTRVQPFDLDILQEVFHLRETGPIDLPGSEKGDPTIAGNSKSESKDKEKKHKKQDRNKEKDREHRKHNHRSKDRSKEKHKENKKDKSGHHDSGADHLKKHHEKKRKHDADEDLNDVQRHKKSKHKSSKIDEMGAIKVTCGGTWWLYMLAYDLNVYPPFMNDVICSDQWANIIRIYLSMDIWIHIHVCFLSCMQNKLN